MKILVTGAKGQLGYDVIKALRVRGIECQGVDIEDFDITNYSLTEKYIKRYNPYAVIHCSAYTAVDKAEDEAEVCYKVNTIGTENIAKCCRNIDAKMIYISTDYVFSGNGKSFYEIDDITDPISIYGKTKLAGEYAIKDYISKYFIVRISWVFGINGNNFIKTMLKLGENQKMVNVVGDQIGSPTYTADLAELLCDMVISDKYGIYHATNEGVCSWAEFAEEIFKQAKLLVKVNYISSDNYQTKAKRPKNSRLSKRELEKNGFKKLPIWQDALRRYLSELQC